MLVPRWHSMKGQLKFGEDGRSRTFGNRTRVSPQVLPPSRASLGSLRGARWRLASHDRRGESVLRWSRRINYHAGQGSSPVSGSESIEKHEENKSGAQERTRTTDL
jgi:hypothetical protein